jgi:hypothetical protein
MKFISNAMGILIEPEETSCVFVAITKCLE